jgi:hypothetical protein
MPLLPQVRRRNDKNAPLSLGPFLGDDQTGFDGLAEPNFVGEQGAFRQRGFEREEGGVDLVGV